MKTPEQCGEARFERRWNIRSCLLSAGLSMSGLARRIGVSPQAVADTVKGRNHSERVLDALRLAGVPERYLFDPRRTVPAGKEAAA